jgi:hypothetical protein
VIGPLPARTNQDKIRSREEKRLLSLIAVIIIISHPFTQKHSAHTFGHGRAALHDTVAAR